MKTRTEKIVTFLKKYNKDFDKELDQNIAIANASQAIQNEGLIDFDFNYRECESACWLQCEFYSSKIKKTIIIDYDVAEEYDSIDDFIVTLLEYQEAVEKLEAMLPIANN